MTSNPIAGALGIDAAECHIGFRDEAGKLVNVVDYYPARDPARHHDCETAYALHVYGEGNPGFTVVGSYPAPDAAETLRRFCQRFFRGDKTGRRDLAGLAVETETKQTGRDTLLELEFRRGPGYARDVAAKRSAA